MFIITKKDAIKKSLAVTSEGMHFKGQFLPKESFIIFGKKTEFIEKAFSNVVLVKYKDKEYFISDILLK